MLPTTVPVDKTSYGYIAWVVTLYWIVSIAMVYLNKILLSSKDASIPAPLFVTWYSFLYSLACIIHRQHLTL